MPLTTALYTGLSGLTVSQDALDVIGNNISNVNTTGFKSSRAIFQPQFSETKNFGSPPQDQYGGSNPIQKGLGVTLGTIQRDWSRGNIKPTKKGDLAIEGAGFFILDGKSRSYTRNGTFELNAEKYIVSTDGQYVLGFGIDSNFGIIQGKLDKVQIPMGMMTIAQATSNVSLVGTLLTDADLATTATTLRSDDFKLASGGVIDGTTLMIDLQNANGDLVFSDGETLKFEGRRGGNVQGPRTLSVDATTTVDDMLSYMVDAFGIDMDPVLTPTPGAIISANGIGADLKPLFTLDITGNIGYANRLEMGTGGLQSDQMTGPGMPIFVQLTEANGESVFTSQTVFDSLGNPLELNMTFIYESHDNTGTTWRFFTNSPDDTASSTVLGTGTVKFDTKGMYVSATNTTIRLDRNSTGALTPLSITLDFKNVQALNKGVSDVKVAYQDGWEAGTLTDYSIAADGTIIGAFDNGMTRAMGQIATATFSNPGGLVDSGSSRFTAGPNSGEAVIGSPLSGSSGKIVDGAIETSNVNISEEFVNLITASTGFSASSRIITTSNQLLTELLSIIR